MFSNSYKLKTIIVGYKWDTSKVKSMAGMFDGAWVFNQSIGNWDVSNVIFMEEMFYNAKSFNQQINDWDVSTKYMSRMFIGAKSMKNIPDWYKD